MVLIGDKRMIERKPDEKLVAGLYNFSAVAGKSVWGGEGGELLDPFFSEFACQACGSKLAGDRYYCTATIGKKHTDPREKLEVCVDCYLYFFA